MSARCSNHVLHHDPEDCLTCYWAGGAWRTARLRGLFRSITCVIGRDGGHRYTVMAYTNPATSGSTILAFYRLMEASASLSWTPSPDGAGP